MVTAALVLMAISFIFGPLRSVTLGQRVFTGVLVGFVFRIAQDLLGPSSQVFGFPPLLAVVIPAGICALAGVWLLRRAVDGLSCMKKPTSGSAFLWLMAPWPEQATQRSSHFFCFGTRTSWLSE